MKRITVTDDTWKKLVMLKAIERCSSFDGVIKKLISFYIFDKDCPDAFLGVGQSILSVVVNKKRL